MKKTVFSILLFVFALQFFAQSQNVSFTLDDRDRIMRTEEKLVSLRNEMNTKFEAVDTQIEMVKSKIETSYWGFGILITLMLFLFGYIVWDRKTTLSPVQNKTINL
ncbi:MAG: hypothetical protein U9R19_12735 [Bacteroidota bacterium]|nr:hypothetical protein [Bacteroidota bacterium]